MPSKRRRQSQYSQPRSHTVSIPTNTISSAVGVERLCLEPVIFKISRTSRNSTRSRTGNCTMEVYQQEDPILVISANRTFCGMHWIGWGWMTEASSIALPAVPSSGASPGAEPSVRAARGSFLPFRYQKARLTPSILVSCRSCQLEQWCTDSPEGKRTKFRPLESSSPLTASLLLESRRYVS